MTRSDSPPARSTPVSVGAGIGMLISPMFDFILASVRDHEVGSASGILNAIQQLASAIGVAAIGTAFFSTLGRSGYTAAIRQSLMIEVGVAAVLFVLACALPRRPRDAQATETEPSATAAIGAHSRTRSTGPSGNLPAPNHPAALPEPVSASRYISTGAQVTVSGGTA
jgi:hypothetical protein